MQEVCSKLARWAIFTVALSLVPLILDFISKSSNGSSHYVSEVIARGELSLICTALSGVALGELIGLSEKAKIAKILLGGTCFLSAVLSICLYLGMKGTTGDLGSEFLDHLCWWLFAETLFTTTITIAVSEALK